MDFKSETYRRYLIRSGPLKGVWTAMGYRRKTLVASATGETREDAVSAVKVKLDVLDEAELSECDEEGAPTAAQYEKAFAELLPDFNDAYLAMLRAHLASPNYLITATKLAEAAGYAGYEGANLHYGKLGQRVAEETGYSPPRRKDGTAIWTCAIARDPSSDPVIPESLFLETLISKLGDEHFEWQMRPQVVDALRALGF